MQLLLIGVYLILTVSGLILMKLGENPGSFSVENGTLTFGINWISAIGFICYLFSFLLFTRIVVMFDLSYIFPIITGIVQILALIASAIVFKEHISVTSVIGVSLIIIGIIIMNYKRVYEDICMNRLKTFLKYLIIFVAFYIFTDLLTSIALSNNYKQMQCEGFDSGSYVVEMKNSKSTSVSGYVDGTIKLKQEYENPEKYLEFDFYSKYGNLMGRKYLDLSKVDLTTEQEFKVNFDYDDIAKYEVKATNDVQKISEIQKDMISKGYMALTVVGALIVLYYVL